MRRKEIVTEIIGGDTFKTASRKHPVRLANVYASEMGQRDAANAKKKLSGLIKNKQVIIQTLARDKHGRSVAHVRVDNKSVNAAMRD